MNRSSSFITLAASALLVSMAYAEAPPAAAPKGSSGMCKDGSYTTAATKQGACAGHNGVAQWYADATGKVWVNKATKVYHCPGTQWYGKTGDGAYMSEADAKAQGFKANSGKACGK